VFWVLVPVDANILEKCTVFIFKGFSQLQASSWSVFNTSLNAYAHILQKYVKVPVEALV
jgi:hypothetical protein